MRKLILLEINEVPHKVYKHFIQHHPETELAKLIKSSVVYTTKSTDQGELHPWSTWPTLHRGIDNTVHGINDIGQDSNGGQLDFFDSGFGGQKSLQVHFFNRADMDQVGTQTAAA